MWKMKLELHPLLIVGSHLKCFELPKYDALCVTSGFDLRLIDTSVKPWVHLAIMHCLDLKMPWRALNKRGEQCLVVHQEAQNMPFIYIPGIGLAILLSSQHVSQMFCSATLCFHSSLVSVMVEYDSLQLHIAIFSLQHPESASTVVYLVQISLWESARTKGM